MTHNESELLQLLLTALNVVQVVALALIAAIWHTGKQPRDGSGSSR